MIRLLREADMVQWVKLVRQLSSEAESYTVFHDYRRLHRDDKEIYVYEKEGRIVGTVSLLFEQKINRLLGLCVHVEDVVVDKDHRGEGIARSLLEFALKRSKERRAYKVILDCEEDLAALYEKVGFKTKGVFMALYL